MKKLTLLLGALVIAGASFACDGKGKSAKACCKKEEKTAACCKKGDKKDCKRDEMAKKETTKENKTVSAEAPKKS